MSTLKAMYISTGVAGYLLAPIPLLNIAGVGLLKLANQALEQYELMYIKDILMMETEEARKLYEATMTDWSNPKDPKVYIALAFAAASDGDELTLNMAKVNDIYYEGVGASNYNGEARNLKDDVTVISSLAASLFKTSTSPRP